MSSILPKPSGCDCFTPAPSACIPIPQHSGVNNIRMFFGYDLPSDISVNPGQLTGLYYTSPVDKKYIEEGFSIPGYSFKSLVDSQILPSGSGPSGSTFILTERELLSTNSYHSWIAYGSYYMYLEATAIGSQTISIPEPFSVVCAKMLAISYPTLKMQAGKMWTSIIGTLDTMPFYGGILSFLAEQSSAFIDLVRSDCDKITDNQRLERLLMCYEWIKNIHDTYYGKEFFINVSPSISQSPNNGSPLLSSPTGICIRNENLALNSGALPASSAPNYNYPYFIDGDGTSQGFYTSDIIVDAGFPKLGSTDILGLQYINWVQNNEGKIESFVKIGDVYDIYNDPNNCAFLNKKVLYKKFKEPSSSPATSPCSIGVTDNVLADWVIDLSKIDTSNYYLDGPTLYLKSSVENRFYTDKDGIWVKLTLSDRVPLSLVTTNPITAVLGFSAILPDDRRIVNQKYKGATNSIDGPGTSALDDLINKFNIVGAKGNTSQVNLAEVNPPCLMPSEAVIPFKSNVYRYGPYFYETETDEDDGGGAEVIVQETIAPWNFIKPNSPSFLISSGIYPYCAMDNFGKTIARLSNKGIQKLEKGRATVVGLPCYGFGPISGFPASGALDPTILTDISVDYGGGGFTTTYNFSTYSPRFGRTERYLLDSWQENIKNTQYINNYLRNEKLKTDNLQKSFNSRTNDRLKNNGLLPKNSMLVRPKHKGATPSRLLFAGYYPHPSGNPRILEKYDVIIPSTGYPGVSGCNPNPSGVFTGIPVPISGSDINKSNRVYTFAESSNAYTIEYVQSTYYQLAGMSMDGFYLPVSLRGVGFDPDESPEFLYEPFGTSKYVFPTGEGQIPEKVIKSKDWKNSGRLPRFSMMCNPISGTFSEWDHIDSQPIFNKPGYPISSKNRDEIPPFKLFFPDVDEFGQLIFPPTGSFKDCYLLPINQFYLNPYTTSGMLLGSGNPLVILTPCTGMPWDDRKGESDKGFVISSIVFGDSHLNFQLSHTTEDLANAQYTNFKEQHTDEWFRQKINNFRVPALRGPLVLQGWGYDTSGKPIPNSNDDEAHTEFGQFRIDGLTDKFRDNWLQNPKSWPTGPIDLRFDRNRGVWTCPSPNKIVVARLKEKLNANGKAKAELINPRIKNKSSSSEKPLDDIAFYENYHISGPNGEDVKLTMENTEIMVYDFLGQTIDECTEVYVYYDDNRYIVLNSTAFNNKKTKAKDIITRFRHFKLCQGKNENPSTYYGDNTWGAYAGYGDKYYNHHTYGIRIDCDGNPIDNQGNAPSETLTPDLILAEPDRWLIELKDNAGKFGPSFGRFIDQQQWIDEASTGYALSMDFEGSQVNIEPPEIDNTEFVEPTGTYDHTVDPVGIYQVQFSFIVFPTGVPGPVVPNRFKIKCGDNLILDTGWRGDDIFKNDPAYSDYWGGGPTGNACFEIDNTCSVISVEVMAETKFRYSLTANTFEECKLGLIECYKDTADLCINIPTFEILFIESYARFLHGCLTQDLYTTISGAIQYGDPYKLAFPYGNAAVIATHFYGDSPNGKEPIFINSDEVRLPIRVFDPWLDKNLNPTGCYNPVNSIFYDTPAGTSFIATFNEKEKKYYLLQTNKPSQNTIRFKAIKLCSSTENTAQAYNNDPWGTFAGYGDKFPNYHTYGIRINCDGVIIDRNGNTTDQEITREFLIDNAENWLVRLNDNSGKFGSSYAIFTDYYTWNSRASTGYATLIDNYALSCGLGNQNDCTVPSHDNLKTYDIIFIESYARFVECVLTQDLYAEADANPEDIFKTNNPSGNASAIIDNYYGDSPNGKIPVFLGQDLQEIPFRVFDPFIGTDIKKNPFAHLKTDDRVLAVFNEDKKKYIIWQSLKSKDENNNVIKFALVTDKNPNDKEAKAVLVDEYGRPIDDNNNLLDDDTFIDDNFITVLDPIRNRAIEAPAPDNGTVEVDFTQTIFGPALGSPSLDDHYNGIRLGDGQGYKQIAPFIGFALKRTIRDYSGDEKIVYEMIMLEHYAKYTLGKICSKYPMFTPSGVTFPCYLGSKVTAQDNLAFGFIDGRIPIARETANLPRGDVVVHEPGNGFYGYHSFIIGDGGVNIPRYDDTDGCGFVATLNIAASTTTHLVYEIIDAERVAIRGTIKLKGEEKADGLNDNNDFTISFDGSDIESNFYQGFMWDKTTNNYITTKIINRPELENRGLFIKGSIVSVSLIGKDDNHNLLYEVITGGTIAKVAHRYIHNNKPGLFGYNDLLGGGIPEADRRIDNEDKFYEGLNPTIINNKPKIDTIRPWVVGPAEASSQWMTFGSGIITALWNETLDNQGKVENCSYEIIYAEQAPVIITGKAKKEIDPLAPNDLAQIEPGSGIFASCRGVNKEPINSGPTLLIKVRNPMGHGAKIGDNVTLQRVYTGVVQDDANYYYMIIGTGDPPGPLK